MMNVIRVAKLVWCYVKFTVWQFWVFVGRVVVGLVFVGLVFVGHKHQRCRRSCLSNYTDMSIFRSKYQ